MNRLVYQMSGNRGKCPSQFLKVQDNVCFLSPKPKIFSLKGYKQKITGSLVFENVLTMFA